MAAFVFKANITDKHGNPLIGVEVEAINCNDFTPALADPIQHVIALATTDISGTATFTGLAPGMYYARPRLTRPDIRIQVMVPSGMGGGGKMCYAALVNPVAGIGTHTTIQSAITALGTTGGLVFICAGTYQENLVVAGDTDDLWLVGAGRGEVLIQGTAASPTITVEAVGTGGVTRFRLEHLTIDHTGAQTLLYFNSVPGGIPTQVDLLDLRFVSGTVGIDFSDINGGSKFTIRDIIMESTVTDAGQLEVSDLIIINAKLYCLGNGLYVSGASATWGTRISDSHLGGGSEYALRIGVSNDVQISNSRIVAVGAGTKGIRIYNAHEVTIDGCILDIQDGVGIECGALSAAVVISDCRLSCAISQSTARVGIAVSGSCTDIHIADTRIKNFESFGIQLETLVPSGAQHYVLDGNIIVNGEDTHSISITGWDFGTITGNVLVGTGGGNTTYGIYGSAGTTYVVIVGNTSEGHDGLTNLTNGVDGNVIGTNTGDGTGLGPSPHDAVTLDVNADTLLSLNVQELGLDTQLANLVFAGAVSGGAAVPAFRSLVDADIPAAIMRDQEHTDIGDAAPHHAAVTLGVGSDAILSLAGQELTLGDVLTPTEHTAIGDAAPHHAAETGESGTHTHGDLYYTETEHGGVSPQGHHALVTLAADAQELLNLSTQALGFVAKAANLVLAGPAAGAAADPTFRSLVDADIPDISATYQVVSEKDANSGYAGLEADGAVPVAHGGSGETTVQAAINILTAVAGATNEHVLTKDTATGNAIFKAAAGGGGTPTLIEDADQDTKVQTEEGADEDIVRMDVAGTERFLLQDSSPYLTLTGDLKISDVLALKGTTPDTNKALNIAPTAEWSSAGGMTGLNIAPVDLHLTGDASSFTGIFGSCPIKLDAGADPTGALCGLNFLAYVSAQVGSGAHAVTQVTGCRVKSGAVAGGEDVSVTVTDLWSIEVHAPILMALTGSTVSVQNYYGIDLKAVANAIIVDGIQLKIGDIQSATGVNYLIEAGPATPYLRLLGSGDWTPAAGETPLYLAEGATPTLRQVKTGGATKEIFIHPRPVTGTGTIPAEGTVDDWPIFKVTGTGEVRFIWKVPPDFASLNSVNIVMIPDTTETVQADLDVSVAAVGEDWNSDTRQLLDQQLAVTINDITEWDIKLGTIFDNIAADDYVAIQFHSDTAELRVLGCRISYEAGGAAMYLD